MSFSYERGNYSFPFERQAVVDDLTRDMIIQLPEGCTLLWRQLKETQAGTFDFVLELSDQQGKTWNLLAVEAASYSDVVALINIYHNNELISALPQSAVEQKESDGSEHLVAGSLRVSSRADSVRWFYAAMNTGKQL